MELDDVRTAILVDGGFYRRRAQAVFGDASPSERAKELYGYCFKHLTERIDGNTYRHKLYRIFYYDCPPMQGVVYNPLTKKDVDLARTEAYSWSKDFLSQLKNKRKVALRLGELSMKQASYSLTNIAFRRLCSGKLKLDEITEKDIVLGIEQKGVDMRIGIDIASLAFKKQVDQIVLISGDSDFVPAAKLAKREGVDFVLDPLGSTIKESLFEHIDGLATKDERFLRNMQNTSNDYTKLKVDDISQN